MSFLLTVITDITNDKKGKNAGFYNVKYNSRQNNVLIKWLIKEKKKKMNKTSIYNVIIALS